MPGVPGAVAALLLLLSIAVLTVVFDRGRWWWQWWQRRAQRQADWQRLRAEDGAAAAACLDDWKHSMRWGEPLLQAAVVLAPLLGLIGTVLGLMQVLASLGPGLVLPPGAPLQGYGQVLLSTALGLIVSLIACAGLYVNQGLRAWQLRRLSRRSDRPER
jgi:biopolymer transport protein ExbB